VTAYRCPAAGETFTNCEQLVDILAEKVGIDPLEFRYRNAWREGDCDPLWGEQPRVFVIPGILDTLRPKYERLKAHALENSTPKKELGVGIALGSYKISYNGDRAEVDLELNPDGTITVYNTWEDMGQGADIGTLAITHEALRPMNVPPEKIRLVMNDTATCPDSGFAASSRSNLMLSGSTKNAAVKLMDAMRKSDGTYRTYEEMKAEDIPTKYTGVFNWPANPKVNELTGFGGEAPDQSYCSFVAEVEVDVHTGKTTVLELHCVTDVGVTTNLLSLEGQAYSGMMHSTGYALYEEFSNFKKHTSMAGSGFTYIERMPDDDKFTLTNIGTPRDYSSFGGSGCSEGFQSAGHVAILNAIANAVGVRVKSTPATPEKIKRALEEKRNGTYSQERLDWGVDFNERLDHMKNNPPTGYKGSSAIEH
jgi:aldehyde oxidoreductase